MAEIKGIERITERILEEADAYAAAKDAETKEKCETLLSERARISAQKTEQILARADADAAFQTEARRGANAHHLDQPRKRQRAAPHEPRVKQRERRLDADDPHRAVF